MIFEDLQKQLQLFNDKASKMNASDLLELLRKKFPTLFIKIVPSNFSALSKNGDYGSTNIMSLFRNEPNERFAELVKNAENAKVLSKIHLLKTEEDIEKINNLQASPLAEINCEWTELTPEQLKIIKANPLEIANQKNYDIKFAHLESSGELRISGGALSDIFAQSNVTRTYPSASGRSDLTKISDDYSQLSYSQQIQFVFHQLAMKQYRELNHQNKKAKFNLGKSGGKILEFPKSVWQGTETDN